MVDVNPATFITTLNVHGANALVESRYLKRAKMRSYYICPTALQKTLVWERKEELRAGENICESVSADAAKAGGEEWGENEEPPELSLQAGMPRASASLQNGSATSHRVKHAPAVQVSHHTTMHLPKSDTIFFFESYFQLQLTCNNNKERNEIAREKQ